MLSPILTSVHNRAPDVFDPMPQPFAEPEHYACPPIVAKAVRTGPAHGDMLKIDYRDYDAVQRLATALHKRSGYPYVVFRHDGRVNFNLCPRAMRHTWDKATITPFWDSETLARPAKLWMLK